MATGRRADRVNRLVIGLNIVQQKAWSLWDHLKRVSVWAEEFEEINSINQAYMQLPSTEPRDGSWEMLHYMA